jgi:hypothetical protein
MRARSIEPTAATLGTLLMLASEAGAWGRVVEAWGWLHGSGLPVHVGCANTYLTALLKLVSQALTVLFPAWSHFAAGSVS